METYKIEIIETLSKTVEVTAENADAAYNEVYELYRNGLIVLGADDFIDAELYELPKPHIK